MRKPMNLILISLMIAAGLTVTVVGSIQASGQVCEWIYGMDFMSTLCSSVGIGLPNPGERLHIGDGNILLEGGGETAFKIKRDIVIVGGPSGTSTFPIFQIGRIITAGDGDPELRFLYSDDITPERAVAELDRKGIFASVKPDRGSHFEGFISGTDPEPIFRLNSWPKMRLEMGNGGTSPVDVAIQRETTNTLTFIVSQTEQIRIDSTGIEISNGYVKLATTPNIPPATDCDPKNNEHIGRMKMDSKRFMIYICTSVGWGWTTIISTPTISLPTIGR